MTELVSVVVPCYNCEDFVEDTLLSLQQQTYPNFEVIMLDDCCTDNTPKILTKFARQDKRFRVIRHKANSGLSAARNSGARAAHGKYVCFLDSDDLMMPECLAVRVEAIENSDHKKAIGSYCGSITIPEDTKYPPKIRENPRLNNVTYLSSTGRCPFNANQPLLIRSIFLRIGGFDEHLKQAEDYDLWMRILRAGFIFEAARWDAVTYRARQSSMVRKAPLHHADLASRFHKTFYRKLPSNDAYRISPSFYHEAGDSYLYQAHIFNRICEFAGMAIANGEPQEEIAAFVASKLPDALTLFDRKHLRVRINHGIARFFANDHEQTEAEAGNLESTLVQITELLDHSDQSKKLDVPCDDGTGLLWAPNRQRNIDVLFFPHKDYHVWTISLLRPALDRMGVNYGVVDFSAHYRDEGVRTKAEELQIPLIRFGNFVMGDFEPKLLIAFNDWDPIIRSIFRAAKSAEIGTASIVEGIQDYLDADTGRVREPYLSSDLVIVPGKHDLKYFTNEEQVIEVGGVPRILQLIKDRKALSIKKRKSRTSKIALINSNFSYGVLEEHRDHWLTSAVSATKQVGLIPIVSRHPADKGELFPELISGESFYDDLDKSEIVIQRFASGILEALAAGKTVIYFNPHDEKVDKFKDPKGAFYMAKDQNDLADKLNYALNNKPCEEDINSFLDYHCNINDSDMNENIANKIFLFSERKNRPDINFDIFRSNLEILDRVTGAYHDLKILSEAIPATYGKHDLNGKDLFSDWRAELEKNETSFGRKSNVFNLIQFDRTGKRLSAEHRLDMSTAEAKNYKGVAQKGLDVAALNASRRKSRSRRSARMAKLKRDPHLYFKDSRFPPFRLLRFLFKPTGVSRWQADMASKQRREMTGPFSFLPASRRSLAAGIAALKGERTQLESALRAEIASLRRDLQAQKAELGREFTLSQDEIAKLREEANARATTEDKEKQALYRELGALGERTSALKQEVDAKFAAQPYLDAELNALRGELSESEARTGEQLAGYKIALSKALQDQASIKSQLEALEATSRKVAEAEQKDIEALKSADASQAKSTTLLRQRVMASERQIGALRYPQSPQTLVFFGHHKCASRLFRSEIFQIVAQATGAKIHQYKIATPPFHYSRGEELDLCNIDFDAIGKSGRDVVLFSNASERTLERLDRSTTEWKGIRVIRDPRQVLVSNYFHHKGDHHFELNGWVYDQLKKDQPILRELPEEKGLLHELDHISKDIIETQILAPFDDDRILTIKLEEFAQDQEIWLKRISEFLEVAEIAGADLSRTFANPDSSPWPQHFTSRLREVFKERYGHALIELGYAKDLNW